MRKKLVSILLFMLLIPAAWAMAQSEPAPVLKALDDLNQRLGMQLTLSDLNWRWSQDVYPDSSLGCLLPGQTVNPGQVTGYQVTLFYEDIIWDYRVSANLETVILCSPQATPTPTVRPTNTPPPTSTLDPSREPAPIVCAGSPAFRIQVGTMGRVALNGLPNNVRSMPDSTGTLSGELKAGSAFYVLDGPVCSGGLAWWYISETTSNLMGWTPEGRGLDYWLEPYYPYGTPTLTVNLTVTATATIPGGFPTGTPTPITPSPTATLQALPSMTTTGFPTTTAIVCSSALPPRLVIGRSGRVTPGIPNNLRQGPGSSTAYVGEIPPGGIFSVLDGPRCASGIAWWQVSYNGVTGWTPEGQGSEYWVEPMGS